VKGVNVNGVLMTSQYRTRKPVLNMVTCLLSSI